MTNTVTKDYDIVNSHEKEIKQICYGKRSF